MDSPAHKKACGKVEAPITATPCPKMPIVPVNWHLEQFPVEVLGQIGSYSGGKGLIRLLKCGAPILSSKLSSKHCTLDIWQNDRLKAFTPLLIGLKGLIGVNLFGECENLSAIQWSALPRPLHKFHCSAMNATELQRFHDEIADFSEIEFFSLSWADPDVALQKGVLNMTTVLAQLLPRMSNLRVLKMGKLGTLLPADLPPTLTELQYGISNLEVQHFIPTLSMLTNLSLPETFRIYVPESMPLFPALKTLHVPKAGFQYTRSVDPLQQQPFAAETIFFSSFPSLTELSISYQVIPHLSKMSAANSDLPACWEKLKVLHITGGVTKRFTLPPSLTSFSARLGQLEHPEYLPKSIRFLALPETEIVCKSLKDFPPLLSKLSINFDALETMKSKIELPNLTHLEHSGDFGHRIDMETILPLLPPSLILLDHSRSRSCLNKIVRAPDMRDEPKSPTRFISLLGASESDFTKHMSYLRLWGTEIEPSDYKTAISECIRYGRSPMVISSLARQLSLSSIMEINLKPMFTRVDRLQVCQALFEGKTFTSTGVPFDFLCASLKTCDPCLLDYLLHIQAITIDDLWCHSFSKKWPKLVEWLLGRKLVTARSCVEHILNRWIWHRRSRDVIADPTKTTPRLISTKDASCFQQKCFDSMLQKLIFEKETILEALVPTLELVLPIFRSIVPGLNLSTIFVNFLRKFTEKLEDLRACPNKTLCEPFSESTLLWFNSQDVELLSQSADNGFNVIHAAIAVNSPKLLTVLSTRNASQFSMLVQSENCVANGRSNRFEPVLEFAKSWGGEYIMSHLRSLLPQPANSPQDPHSVAGFLGHPEKVGNSPTPLVFGSTAQNPSFISTSSFGQGCSKSQPTLFGTTRWTYEPKLLKNTDFVDSPKTTHFSRSPKVVRTISRTKNTPKQLKE